MLEKVLQLMKNPEKLLQAQELDREKAIALLISYFTKLNKEKIEQNNEYLNKLCTAVRIVDSLSEEELDKLIKECRNALKKIDTLELKLIKINDKCIDGSIILYALFSPFLLCSIILVLWMLPIVLALLAIVGIVAGYLVGIYYGLRLALSCSIVKEVRQFLKRYGRNAPRRIGKLLDELFKLELEIEKILTYIVARPGICYTKSNNKV